MKQTVVSEDIYIVFNNDSSAWFDKTFSLSYSIYDRHTKVLEVNIDRSKREIISEIQYILRLKYDDLPLYVNTISNPFLAYRIKKGE